MDRDGIPDICDDDIDGDWLPNLIWLISFELDDCSITSKNINKEILLLHNDICSLDNCPFHVNPDQMDINNNWRWDVCDGFVAEVLKDSWKWGCTDPNAYNYNPYAKNNNGSCKYPPKVKNVKILWNNTIGSLLTWIYTYEWHTPEGKSKYQRYKDGVPIQGATRLNYIIKEEDSWGGITFEVTPVDEDGAEGDSVRSDTEIEWDEWGWGWGGWGWGWGDWSWSWGDW
jgi:hypothetical protein